ncbi:hypothetical protein OIU78_019753 [Salix suchowensis]|nr:hypothetical protein OIU78_019753 [Salix suchowensis]
MGKSGKISQYRERLDKTLASPELTNLDALKTLIRNQLARSSPGEIEGCSDNLIENRTNHVSSFLDMLRSASVSETGVSRNSETSHGEWKIKEDHEEFRVMYRPGPQGTPFHSLLAEGYVDGTVDTCLCISWEATLYRKWWPQYSFPPFRITICECLQRIRIGEQISLVRVKVTWPLTAREAVLHYVLFEYLQDGLVIVVASTKRIVLDYIAFRSQMWRALIELPMGFSKDGIPEAKEVVRIDVMGGFAIQKVTSERSYFRTIANMDLKVDFVPPSLINFISRQLVGNGFRLYKKNSLHSNFSGFCATYFSDIQSANYYRQWLLCLNYDEDYSKALKDPMYARIREALYSTENANVAVEEKVFNSDASILQKEHSTEDRNAEVVVSKSFSETEEENNGERRGFKDENMGGLELNTARKDFLYSAPFMVNKTFGEIKEENDPESRHSVVEGKVYNNDASLLQKELSTEDVEGNLGDFELNIHGDNDATEAYSENTEFVVSKSFGEIEEENNEESRGFKDENMGGLELNTASKAFPCSAPLMDNKSFGEIKEENDPESRLLKDGMRGEEQRGRALETLEKVISVIRETRSSSSKTNGETPYLEKDVEIDPTHLKNSGVFPKAGVSAEVSDKEIPVERNSHESRNSSSNSDIRRAGSRETNHNKRTPASPDQCISIPNETNHVALYSSQSKKDGTEEVQTMDIIAQGNQQMSLEVNGIHENVFHEGKKTTRQKHYRYCCLGSRYE